MLNHFGLIVLIAHLVPQVRERSLTYVCMYVCIVCMYYIYMFHGNIGFFLGKHLKRGLMETKKFDIFDYTP